MGELIDREKLLEFAHNHIGGVIDCNDIARFPAVDAEPVRRVEWVHIGGDEWYCNRCFDVIHTEGFFQKPTKKYCPNCGARMKEETNE